MNPSTVAAAEDRTLPGHPQVALRIHRVPGARGVFLHFHPGGFIHGDAAMCDVPNRRLAAALGVHVVSVGYRLAPAHPHPAAVEDGVAAALWLIETGARELGGGRLLIGGESAGAALAALTLLALRDRHGAARQFAAASFIVGGFDFSMTPSQRAARAYHFLNAERLAQTRDAAFPGRSLEALRDPAISPLYADLAGLPPAIFTCGGADSMVDDSLFMAARWRQAGNGAQLEVWPGGDHLFMSEPTPQAAEAQRRIEAFLAEQLAAGGA